MTVTQNIASATAMVIAAVLGSLLVMAALNRVWPREKRRVYNDVIGWQLTILGTTYAVILGFMLYAVWERHGEAALNVDAEANAVLDVYRLADGLPEPQRTQLRQLARDYVDRVIAREWPQMLRGEAPEQITNIDQEMWKIVISTKPASPSEVNAQEHATLDLQSLSQRRLTRFRQSKSRLPNVLWCVLLVGGVLTILCSCTLGYSSVKLQSLEVFCFSLFIAISLVSVVCIHRPFYGLVHVTDYSFEQARQSMQSH